MSLDDVLGRVVLARVARFAPPGAYVLPVEEEAREEEGILLPNGEVPEGTEVGSELEVFVYLDSEDRPVATARAPRLEIGDVVFLEVKDVTRVGAFFDWGLAKDLLVPFAEQTKPPAVGERHPVGLYLDGTGRLAGTMKVSELLDDGDAKFDAGEWVEGEAWRKDPDIGVFVIVERGWVGLLPKSEPNTLVRGQAARFRVARVHPDGRIELSLREPAHLAREGDAGRILAELRKGELRIGDRSSPEEILTAFGLSKKAFKRAVGHLLAERAVTVDGEGFLVAAPAAKGAEPRTRRR